MSYYHQRVPFVPHTAVINKTIVYSDTVLPLKDSGNNLKVTSISDVMEYEVTKKSISIYVVLNDIDT